MSNPVDIKIARINKSENVGTSINKDKVHEVFQRNINDKLKSFYRLQQDWVNRAYKNFNDFDTYLILMYLMNKVSVLAFQLLQQFRLDHTKDKNLFLYKYIQTLLVEEKQYLLNFMIKS